MSLLQFIRFVFICITQDHLATCTVKIEKHARKRSSNENYTLSNPEANSTSTWHIRRMGEEQRIRSGDHLGVVFP